MGLLKLHGSLQFLLKGDYTFQVTCLGHCSSFRKPKFSEPLGLLGIWTVHLSLQQLSSSPPSSSWVLPRHARSHGSSQPLRLRCSLPPATLSSESLTLSAKQACRCCRTYAKPRLSALLCEDVCKGYFSTMCKCLSRKTDVSYTSAHQAYQDCTRDHTETSMDSSVTTVLKELSKA